MQSVIIEFVVDGKPCDSKNLQISEKELKMFREDLTLRKGTTKKKVSFKIINSTFCREGDPQKKVKLKI